MKKLVNFKGDIDNLYKKIGLTVDYLGGQYLMKTASVETTDCYSSRIKKIRSYILAPKFFMKAFWQVEKRLSYQMFSDLEES